MDEENQTEPTRIGDLVPTTISYLEQRRQQAVSHLATTNSVEERTAKARELARLALHFWRPDFTPRQAELLLADYLEDFSGRPSQHIVEACKAWRRDASSRFFPTSGQLLALMPRLPDPEPEAQPLPRLLSDEECASRLAAFRKALGRSVDETVNPRETGLAAE